jgi:hypothetical protein
MEMTQTVTAALAGRIRAIRYEELPPEVLTVARRCLDWS